MWGRTFFQKGSPPHPYSKNPYGLGLVYVFVLLSTDSKAKIHIIPALRFLKGSARGDFFKSPPSHKTLQSFLRKVRGETFCKKFLPEIYSPLLNYCLLVSFAISSAKFSSLFWIPSPFSKRWKPVTFIEAPSSLAVFSTYLPTLISSSLT